MTLPLEAHLRRPLVRRPLARLPSPLESHPALAAECGLASFLVKRDDLAGGNKRRALEWLLPAAGPALVTMGAYGSTWCAALAAATGGTGQRAEVALFPQPLVGRGGGGARHHGGRRGVHLAARRWQLPLAVARAWARRAAARARHLAAGRRRHPAGVLGSVNALLECAGQLTAEGFPRPEAIVVPYGPAAPPPACWWGGPAGLAGDHRGGAGHRPLVHHPAAHPVTGRAHPRAAGRAGRRPPRCASMARSSAPATATTPPRRRPPASAWPNGASCSMPPTAPGLRRGAEPRRFLPACLLLAYL
ncbi:MAG: hypothetical protein IPJ57_20315 [Gemmatimonadetes bacterium]|nr:hypothetical protein [Gemmatimonadota bacterium]